MKVAIEVYSYDKATNETEWLDTVRAYDVSDERSDEESKLDAITPAQALLLLKSEWASYDKTKDYAVDFVLSDEEEEDDYIVGFIVEGGKALC